MKRSEQLWQQHYNGVMNFMQMNKRRPSKYKPEERNMVDWIKYNKKRMTRGKMSEERIEKFKRLLRLGESMQRKNQYAYVGDKRRKRILRVEQVQLKLEF